jgi:hypothetical protein
MKPAVGHRLTMILARSYTAIHLANGNYIEAIEVRGLIVTEFSQVLTPGHSSTGRQHDSKIGYYSRKWLS